MESLQNNQTSKERQVMEEGFAKYLDDYMSKECEPTKLFAFLLSQWILKGGDRAKLDFCRFQGLTQLGKDSPAMFF